MIVLPAPGSSASRNRSGWRGSISLVDRLDLVRQRLEVRGLDGQERVEHPGQLDPARLGGEPEELAVGVERPRPPSTQLLEPVFVLPEEHLLRNSAALVAECDG